MLNPTTSGMASSGKTHKSHFERLGMAKYKDIGPGESFPVSNTEMKIACCDCGLVHKLEVFANEKGFMMMRFTRDRRATAAIRRETRKRKEADDDKT